MGRSGLFIWSKHDHIPYSKMNEMNWKKNQQKRADYYKSRRDSTRVLSWKTIYDFCLKVHECDEILLEIV